MHGPSISRWSGVAKALDEPRETRRSRSAGARNRVRRTALLVGVASLTVPAAARAEAPLWGGPHRLSAPGARNAAVAVGVGRDGIVAWSRPDPLKGDHRIEAATRSRRGWRRPRLIGRANPLMGQSPVVAMDRGGDAYVGWIASADNALNVAIHVPGTPWFHSAIAADARDAELAVDDAGDAAAVWVHLGQVEFAARPRSSAWSPPQVLSSPTLAAEHPRLAMSASGDVFVLWVAGVGGVPQAQATIRPAGQPFGSVQTLSVPGAAVAAPVIASDAEGDAAAAWAVTSSPMVVQTAVRRAGQIGFDAPVALASRPAVSPVAVAVGPRGRAVVTWVSRFVEVTERTTGGRWTAPRRVSGPRDSIASPALVAADRAGDEAIAWSGSSRTPRRQLAVHVADRHARGPWRPAQVVSARAEQDPSDPALALGGRANGLLAWRSLLPGSTFVISAVPRRGR